MNRRKFIRNTAALGTVPLILGGMPMRAFGSNMKTNVTCSEVQDRVLIMVQLHGGNDGLNTLIPTDQYGQYINARPTVGIRNTGNRAYLGLTAAQALHPDMTGVRDMFNNGMVNFVQNVGYDNFDRSHFKGIDLWLTGGDTNPNNQNLGAGFMGQYLNHRFPNYPIAYPNTFMPDPPAIELGSNSISLAFHRSAGSPIGLAIGNSATNFYNLVSGVGGLLPQSVPSTHHGDQLQFIMDIERSSNAYATRINDAFNLGANSPGVTYHENYPLQTNEPGYQNELGPQLKTIARLIDGGLKTKVFMTRLTGFDNHSNQVTSADPSRGRHAMLLYHLSQSIKSFYDDLTASGNADKVVVATFSEFGRQVQQNGSRGTDHGTTAPMMIFGSGISGGITGPNPDFNSVTGNIFPNKSYDYRQVFTTLLQDWLGAGPNALQSANFQNFATQKIPIVANNFKTPATCYAGAFDVGLLSFDAVLESDGRVRVNWQTATETNNDYFEVQRSTDGTVFESFARVAGAGTTSQRQTYLSFDGQPHEGLGYYRLKQVDFDGTYHVFDPVSVLVSPTDTLELEARAYPNPASEEINLRIVSSSTSELHLLMLSTGGKKVYEETIDLQAGTNTHRIEASSLSPGIYMLEAYIGSPGQYDYKRLASIKQVIQR